MTKFTSRVCAAAALAATMFAAAGGAQATVLFDNGSEGYAVGYSLISTVDGSPPNFAADSFTLGQASTVNQVVFDSWTDTGVKVTGVGWTIFDSAGVPGGNVLASGFASVTSTHLTKNLEEYDINADSFTIPDLNLAAGTYWLGLSDAQSTNPDEGTGWDQTVDGPQSYATDATGGHRPNTFTILGTVGPTIGDGGTPVTPVGPAPGVPEPASWALMLLGFGGVGASLRTARHRRALAV